MIAAGVANLADRVALLLLPMVSLLLFEMIWKVVYLTAFALPLWSTHQINEAVAEDIKTVVMVVIFIPLSRGATRSRSGPEAR